MVFLGGDRRNYGVLIDGVENGFAIHQLKDGPVFLRDALHITQVKVWPVVLRVIRDDDVIAQVDVKGQLLRLRDVSLEVL